MLKKLSVLLIPLLALPILSACGKTNYYDYVSEAKEDIFLAETQTYRISLSCITREYPYISDGVPCPTARVIEISLTSDDRSSPYSAYLLGEKEIGGELGFRTFADDFFFSQSVEEFPEGSVTLRIEKDGASEEITATSVKNEKTLTPKQALARAVESEKETIKSMTGKDGFAGEFYVRLLRRETNYYYVGIIDKNGGTLSLLLDGETGEVLARRKTQG